MQLKINLILFFLLIMKSAMSFADAKYLFADKIEYNEEEEYVEAIGNVHISYDDYAIKADRILYDIKKNEVWSYGKIIAKDQSSYLSFGEAALIKNKAKEVIISSFIIYFEESDAIIAAKMAIRKNKEHYRLTKASYTSCPACKDHKPLWQISASRADIYWDEHKASYRNMFFKIYGLPIIYFPFFAHSLPGAKPKSGFLIPNIRHKKPGLPFYIRPKSNFDAVITPRISKDGGLYDIEVRHLLDYGSYNISGLTLGNKSRVRKYEDSKFISEKNIGRYSISGIGAFHKNNIHYGFKINRVSDRDFLRKFSSIERPFLLSNIYTFQTSKANFWEINNTFLQGLGTEDRISTDPKILPEIAFRKSVEIEKLGDANFALENYTSSYMRDDLGRISRSIWEVNLHKSFVAHSGLVLGSEIYNRSDIYNLKIDNLSKEKHYSFIRNIPEARLSLRYPLLSRIKNNSLIIEPIGLIAFGKQKIKESKKLYFIDSDKYDFDDINLYKHNKFNGYDYHEKGNRVTYGIHSILKNDNGLTFGFFAGQLQNISKNEKQKPNIVGRTYLNFHDEFEVYYRFKRKSKNFRSAFDEVGFWINKNKVTLNGGYINLSKSELLSDNAIRQIYLDTNYNYNQNWSFGIRSRIDVAKAKIHEMNRGLGVTYRGDCVTISTNFTRDYTSDSSRGISKTSDYSVAISLKTLNM